MQVFGKQISKWWLLLLAPLSLVALPLLMILCFAVNNFAGAIVGPPAIWNRTRHTLEHNDLVGSYKETERRWDRPKNGSGAALDLHADGSMTVSNLPDDSITTSCLMSGKGTWSGPDGDEKLDLNLISDGAQGSCESGSYQLLELAGQSKPYSLYWVLGDPDSGTGIWLTTQ
jgi:hypothetical protein